MEPINRTLTLTTIAALSLLLTSAVSAAPDPLPCYRAKLQAQARFYQCSSRCENGTTDPATLASCQSQCQDRFDARILAISARPICTGTASPSVSDPTRCMAQIVKARVRAAKCEERCDRLAQSRDSFDVDGCADRCAAVLDAAEARIGNLPHCDGLVLSVPAP